MNRASTIVSAPVMSTKANTLDEALAMIAETDRPVSVGLLGNAAVVFRISQTQHHKRCGDGSNVGTRPTQRLFATRLKHGNAAQMRQQNEAEVVKAAKASMAIKVRAMLDLQARGVATLHYGNNIRQMALEEGVANAFEFPGFVPAYIRPLFCEGIGPFRWAALSGDPEDIYKTDQKSKS